jgi:uncharacterized membrane protein
MSWRTRWKIREFRRNTIWPVPALFVALAIVLGIVMPGVDENTRADIGIDYGASAAQGILGAMAGGMITFTGFVFSILLLAVQFGSSQFSPRMLRRFLRDPTTRISLGMFMATFTYALLVLRRIQPVSNEDFIPDFSVSISFVLLILSMIMFLRLISRTTQGLRVAAVLGDLGHEGLDELNKAYPQPADPKVDQDSHPVIRQSQQVSVNPFTQKPGILQSVDLLGIVDLAEGADVVIELVQPIGDHIGTGEPMFRIHGDAAGLDVGALDKSFAVSDERTINQDPAFIFRLLSDISSKALSPGVNDPTTSVQSLDQIEVLLRLLGRRKFDRGTMKDSSGQTRFLFSTPTWEDFLSIALDETRIFGEGSIQVSRRMRALLEDLHDIVPAYRRAPVEAQMRLLKASVERTFSDPTDREIALTRDRQGVGTPRLG